MLNTQKLQKYWITACDAQRRVIFNKVITTGSLAEAQMIAESYVPAEHHGSICITDENNNPIEEAGTTTASTTTKHTPTPYVAKKGLHGNPYGITIWQEKLPGMVGSKGIAKMSGVHDQHEVEATAAFIVRACNSHVALVNALTLLADKVEACGGYPGFREELQHARAALHIAEA